MRVRMDLTSCRKSQIYSGVSEAVGAIIDCGAGAGHETRDLYLAGSRGPFVMVEPFPGNISLIEKANYPFSYQLHEKALNSDGRSVSFLVPQVVDHTAQGRWEGMDGYSSTGYIPLTLNQKAKAVYKRLFRGSQSLRVAGVTLDEICAPFERIRLIKTDLQRAEYEALKGAQETLRREAADIYILEFMGDIRIFDFFDSGTYEFFPIEILRMGLEESPRIPGFEVYDTDISSTKKVIEYYCAQDRSKHLSIEDFMDTFSVHFSQCDLLIVHRRAVEAFSSAVMRGNP